MPNLADVLKEIQNCEAPWDSVRKKYLGRLSQKTGRNIIAYYSGWLQGHKSEAWKLLIDRKMSKNDLRLAPGVSTSVIAKLGKGENVTTNVLLRICDVLICDTSDIMEVERNISKESL
jgi:DNA-binding Xre family transcriptional regulator